MKMLAAATVLVIGMVFAVRQFLITPGCSFTAEEARSALVEQLVLEKLDPQFLSAPQMSADGCMCSFSFAGQGRRLEYAIIGDPLHGLKISLWDRDRQPNGP